MAGLCGDFAVVIKLAGDHSDGGVGIDDPGISPASSPGDGRRPVGGYPYGRVRLLYRPGGDPDFGNLVIGAVIFDLIFGPEKADDFHGFDEAGNALGALDTEGSVLLVSVPDPDSEYEAPTRHSVEGSGGLGDVHRVEQGNKEHRGRDLHALGVCGESREEGDDGAHLVRVGEVVLTGAYHVEPGLTGEAGLLGGFGDALRDGLADRVLGVDE